MDGAYNMTFAHFRNDPKGYSKSHQMYLNNSDTGANSMTAAPAAAVAGGNNSQLFTWNNQVISMDRDIDFQPAPTRSEKVGMFFGVTKPRRDCSIIALAPGTADNGLRYLPFRVNHVTYMQMDAAATFCVTGPLTGCTVAAGKDAAGNLWFFHSNDNALAGVAARASQQVMLHAAAATAGVPIANLRWCTMTQQYHGMAFVFGKKSAGDIWKFYVVDHDINHSATNKFAQIN